MIKVKKKRNKCSIGFMMISYEMGYGKFDAYLARFRGFLDILHWPAVYFFY